MSFDKILDLTAVSINNCVERMQIQVNIKQAKEDGDATPAPPSPLLILPSPRPDSSEVTRDCFMVERSYYVLSACGDGHVLSASNRKSDRKSQFGGYRLDFVEDSLWKKRDVSAVFTFSGRPGAYRMHSGAHHNNMLYFLGRSHQLDWVVWDCAVPMDGDWEKMELVWQDDRCSGSPDCFIIKFFNDYYVKWVVSGFTGVKELDEATKFVLHDVV